MIQNDTDVYKVKVAEIEDVSLLAELGARTFYDTFAAENTEMDMQDYIRKTFSRERILHELNDKTSTFLICFVDDVAAGYAKLQHNKNPASLPEKKAIEIERLYVIQSLIGKKVGKFLMLKCIDIARQGSYELIWLGVWEKNVRAIEFYKKFGFEVFGSQKFVLGNDVQDDLLMKKELSNTPGL
jgi:diamine N-acetyltransferase